MREEWTTPPRRLCANCRSGVEASGDARAAMQKAGYSVRLWLGGEKGRICDTTYIIYEKPHDTMPPTPEEPVETEPD